MHAQVLVGPLRTNTETTWPAGKKVPEPCRFAGSRHDFYEVRGGRGELFPRLGPNIAALPWGVSGLRERPPCLVPTSTTAAQIRPPAPTRLACFSLDLFPSVFWFPPFSCLLNVHCFRQHLLLRFLTSDGISFRFVPEQEFIRKSTANPCRLHSQTLSHPSPSSNPCLPLISLGPPHLPPPRHPPNLDSVRLFSHSSVFPEAGKAKRINHQSSWAHHIQLSSKTPKHQHLLPA